MARLAGLGLVVALAVPGAQSTDVWSRLVSAGGATVTAEAFARDVGSADVVVVSGRPGSLEASETMLALLGVVADHRDVVLVLDAVGHAARDPLEHFQMGHVSDEELVAEARLSPATAAVVLPILKFAVSRQWPVVAAGGTAGEAGDAASAVTGALRAGATNGGRPLLVCLQMAGGDSAEWVRRLRTTMAAARWVSIALATAPVAGADYAVRSSSQ